MLDNDRPKTAALNWRVMGQGDYQSIPLQHVVRGVHTVTLPQMKDQAIEYYITATAANGKKLTWPATAPQISQTVIGVTGY